MRLLVMHCGQGALLISTSAAACLGHAHLQGLHAASGAEWFVAGCGALQRALHLPAASNQVQAGRCCGTG